MVYPTMKLVLFITALTSVSAKHSCQQIQGVECPLELSFLLDSSEGITKEQYDKEKIFAVDVVDKLSRLMLQEQRRLKLRLGLLQYSSKVDPTPLITFTEEWETQRFKAQRFKAPRFKDQLQNFEHLHGGTKPNDAVTSITKLYQKKSIDCSIKVAVLFANTAGIKDLSDSPSAISIAEQNGINTIIVGLCSDVKVSACQHADARLRCLNFISENAVDNVLKHIEEMVHDRCPPITRPTPPPTLPPTLPPCETCPCPKGEVGEDGSMGEMGDRGRDGLDGKGKPGKPGTNGMTGPDGPPGKPGSKGKQGEWGKKGVHGIKGEMGPKGPAGVNGLHGHKGLPGPKGDVGPEGPLGDEGERGFPGQTGIPGNPGHGYAGDTGGKGIPGPKGYKGPDGKGLPGVNGPPGVPGIPGENGPPGKPINGPWGAMGRPGPPGCKGDDVVGSKGQKGEPGVQGYPGPFGPEGDGIDGEMGEKGPNGTRGNKGARGEGTRGLQGAHGAHGEAGPKGETGYGKPGAEGDAGKDGRNGLKGSPGAKGDPGQQGEIGLPGSPGPNGEPGFGSPGETGDKGQEGIRGFNGLPGFPGPPGAKGEPGTLGQNGSKGSPGRAIIGPQGHVGPAGPVGDVGPTHKGEPGPMGDRGKLGPDGPEGPTGQGNPGPAGPPGLPGLKGEQCCEVGEGNPGPKGDVGRPGKKGEPGAMGRGIIGQPGPMGKRGPKGLPGPNVWAEQGPTGMKGPRGVDGPKGPPGEGYPGAKGGRGRPGGNGPPGVDGGIGGHGKPGPDGNPGPPGDDGLTKIVTIKLIEDICACTTVCPDKLLELVFVIDSSESVRKEGFEKIKDFVKDLVKKFTIGRTRTRIGLVLYSDNAYLKLSLGKDLTKQRVINEIDALNFIENGTYTGKAIKLATEDISNNAREGVRKVAIVITDGQTDKRDKQMLMDALQLAKYLDIDMYAVGISSEAEGDTFQEELELIASAPEKVHHIKDFDLLSALESTLLTQVCKNKKTVYTHTVTHTHTHTVQPQDIYGARIHRHIRRHGEASLSSTSNQIQPVVIPVLPEVPSPADPRCNLPLKQGPCRDYTEYWYYSKQTNACALFWYGGCGGNDNRFKTLDECKNACIPSGTGKTLQLK